MIGKRKVAVIILLLTLPVLFLLFKLFASEQQYRATPLYFAQFDNRTQRVGTVCTIALNADSVMRPIPALGVVLHVAAVRIGVGPKDEDMTFLAMVEDADGRLKPNHVQYVASELSSNISAVNAYFDGELATCKLMVVGYTNEIVCPVPSSFRSSITAEMCSASTPTILPSIMLHIPAYDAALSVPVSIVAERAYNMTLCVAFLQSPAEHLITEFIVYHSLLGVDHFVFYDRSGKSVKFLEHLAKTVGGGATVEVLWWPGVTVDPRYVRKANNFYDQVVAFNHCLYRYTHRTRWMGHWDLDEYFYSRSPEHRSIPEWLDSLLLPTDAGIRLWRLEHQHQKPDPKRLALEQFSVVCNMSNANVLAKLLFRPEAIRVVMNHYWHSLPGYRWAVPSVDVAEAALLHYLNLYRFRVASATIPPTCWEHRIPNDAWFMAPLRMQLMQTTSLTGERLYGPCAEQNDTCIQAVG